MKTKILLTIIASICCCFQINQARKEESIDFMGAHTGGYGSNPLLYSNVSNTLDTFVANSNGGTKWRVTSSFSVANVNGGEPNDIVNWAYDSYGTTCVAPGPFSDARDELYGDGTRYVGCGLNALYSELEYFAKYGHFDWLGVDDNENDDLKGLAKYLIENTNTIHLGEKGKFCHFFISFSYLLM